MFKRLFHYWKQLLFFHIIQCRRDIAFELNEVPYHPGEQEVSGNCSGEEGEWFKQSYLRVVNNLRTLKTCVWELSRLENSTVFKLSFCAALSELVDVILGSLSGLQRRILSVRPITYQKKR